MATKPTDYPEWDTDETNVLEADASHKLDGWLKPSGVGEKPLLEYFNWFMNLVYKWIIYMAESKTVISTQAEFNTVFDGTTLANANIYLETAGSPYTLNNNVPFGSNLLFDADPGVVVERAGTSRFISTGTVGTPISHIEFTKNWMFDGQGGVEVALGGSTIITGSGGFAVLEYVEDSKFNVEVRNCRVSAEGGAYYDDGSKSYGIEISNIHYCRAATNGGGVQGLTGGAFYNKQLNHIYNISNCIATTGGGTHGSNGVISDIYENSASNGGGVANAYYSVISDIYENEATLSGGGGCYLCSRSDISRVFDNTAQIIGGGLADCSDNTIESVFDNTATTGAGGGLHECHNNVITNIRGNTAATYGGGLYECDRCNIVNVYSNTATTNNGGGVYQGEDNFFSGWFGNNTSGGGSATIHNSNGFAFVMMQGYTNITVTAYGTVNG